MLTILMAAKALADHAPFGPVILAICMLVMCGCAFALGYSRAREVAAVELLAEIKKRQDVAAQWKATCDDYQRCANALGRVWTYLQSERRNVDTLMRTMAERERTRPPAGSA